MTDAPGIADAAVLSFFIFSFSFSEFDALVSTACLKVPVAYAAADASSRRC